MARVQVGVGSTVSIGEIEGATLVTEAEGISSNDNDTTIPTSAAVKDYADSVAGTPTVITVADESTDTTCFPLFVTAATGDLGPKTASGLTFDSSTDTLGVSALSVGSLTGVLRADSGAVSTDSDVTDLVSAATDSAAGIVELALAAEVTTGTDTGRAVTPDALAGSTLFGRKAVSLQVTASDGDVSTGDAQAIFVIPEALNGMDLVRAQAVVYTAGTTNATTIMIRNKTDTADMLSGAISIASGGTVGTVGTINTSTDDVATNDVIAVDVDTVSTTAPQGLMVVLEFQLP